MNPLDCGNAHNPAGPGSPTITDLTFTDHTLLIVVTRNQQRQFRLVCDLCGARSVNLPKVLWELVTQRAERVEVKRNEPARYDPCAITECNNPGVERHHFAPRNTFGWLEAEKWPTAHLCRAHHTEWHQRMNNYQWNRRSIEAAS